MQNRHPNTMSQHLDRRHQPPLHPVLNDGRLYLRYHDTLWCYDVKER